MSKTLPPSFVSWTPCILLSSCNIQFSTLETKCNFCNGMFSVILVTTNGGCQYSSSTDNHVRLESTLVPSSANIKWENPHRHFSFSMV